MRNSSFFWIILSAILLIDIYVFFSIRTLWASGSKGCTVLAAVYWSVSALSVAGWPLLPYLQSDTEQSKWLRSTIMVVTFSLFMAKMVAALFFLIDDVRRGLQWMAAKALESTNNMPETESVDGSKISRSSFLTWLGIVSGGSLFTTFMYGLGNKYNYQIKKISTTFSNLSLAFKGLRMVHISDIHSGSLSNPKAVNRGIDLILEQKPDMILFTGDLVNNKSNEVGEYQKIFSRLNAPLGVFSILGNHDYGDYAQWNSEEEKAKNLETLKKIHANMGWRLLLDEHVPIQKDGATIGLIGVQNISGKSRFHSYGNLHKAMQGAHIYPFKILLSHDPSHWNTEVVSEYTDIDLTLSGHTHGMQFGVEIPGFRWSPVQYIYRHWAGLYTQAHQKLYVNRGFGFLGYPGRVGILPEITVIELT